MRYKKKSNKFSAIAIALLILLSIISLTVLAEKGNGNNFEGTDENDFEPGKYGQNNQGQDNQNTIRQEPGRNRNQFRINEKIDEDGDNVDDRRERHQHRYMYMYYGNDRAEIVSEWEDNGSEDIFRIIFETEDGLKIKFYYLSDINSTEVLLSFEAAIKKLIEYIDVNDNGRYDSNDSIESFYSLEDANYKNITYTNETSSDNETITILHAETDDGIFSITIYVVGNYSTVNNQTITPNEVKMDFKINNYNYLSEESLLSLQTDLITNYTVSVETDTFDELQGFAENESEINISSLEHIGFFSWVNHSLVDNETKPVNVTINFDIEEIINGDEKEVITETTIYFSYSRGDKIIHDPKVGIVSISYETYSSLIDISSSLASLIASFTSYILICILATVLFVGTIYLRKRM